MRKITPLMIILGLAIAPFLPAPAHAQTTRTWVSGVGDDVNPCSRTAPCKTFAGAIGNTIEGGEINCLDSGGFGAVTIAKSMSIVCGGVIAGIVAGSGTLITIDDSSGTPGTAVVYLSGLDLNGANTGANGINFISGKALHVSKTTIRGFAGNGILFAPTTAPSSNRTYLEVQDSTVANNPGGGIRFVPGGTVVATGSLTRVNLNRNLFGLRTDDRSIVTVSYSTVAGNTNNGVIAVSSENTARINLVNYTVSNGLNGVAPSGGVAVIRLLNTAVLENNFGIAFGSGVYGTTPDTNLIASNGTNGAVVANETLQ